MCKQACTHANGHAQYFLVCLGPYLGQIGSYRENEIYIESEGHAGPDYDECLCACTHASAHAQ